MVYMKDYIRYSHYHAGIKLNKPFHCIFPILLIMVVMDFAYGQKNIIPGAIITHQGDTTKGYIDYRNWQRNPRGIGFQQSDEGKAEILFPLDIKGFIVQDAYYLSAIVQSEKGFKETRDFDPRPKLEKDTVFLQLLVSGPRSLYYLKNEWGNENFYIKNDSVFTLLEYKQYLIQVEGKILTRENTRFRGQLRVYFNDTLTQQSALDNIQYNRKDLTKAFQDYYLKKDDKASFIRQQDRVVIKPGILAGFSNSSIYFSPQVEDYEFLSQSDFEKSIDFTGGLYLSFLFPGNHGKWAVITESTYSSFRFEGHYEEIFGADSSADIYSEIHYSYVNLNLLLQYRYEVQKFFFFGDLGVSNGFAVNKTNYKKVVESSSSQINTEEGAAFNDRSVEQRLQFGLGIGYNKFFIESRVEFGNGITDTFALGSSTQKLIFFIGYSF
jgi:hypothetical protein